jgi:hypothetical protein
MSNTAALAGIVASSTKISNDIYYPAFGAVDQNTISAQNYGVILYGPDYPISSYTVSNNNITIANKTSADGSAIWLGSVGNTSTEKSVIYNNRLNGGKNGIYLSAGVNYEKIYNNYISNSDNGLYVSASSSSVGELYFNSFYNAVNNLYFYSSSSAYWKIKNNILYNTSTSASNACIRVGSAITFLACNNNLYYSPNGASVGIYNAVNYATLTTWKAIDHADETTNGDENSVYGNPLYVNVSQNNLDIISSSPAASSGAAISGITKDIYNLTRLTPPFIGAQELLFSLALCNTQTITCAITTATLTGTTLASGVTYSWVGPNSGTPAGSSPTASLTVVSAAGVYTLTITNSVNQSISSTVQVVANNTLPNVNAGSTHTISMTTPTVILTGSSTTSGVTYSWAPGGTTPTSHTTSVSSGGIYTLTVRDTINGCVNSATVLALVKVSVSANITDYENDSLKGIANLTITGGTPPYNVAWNGLKLPTSFVAYHNLIDSLPGIVIDSVEYKNFIDSLRQRTVFNDLYPGTYSVTVYDQNNDSALAIINVGAKITSWGYKLGLTTNACAIANKVINNINYNYGTGECITQQGTYSAGNHFAIPLNIIDLNNDNEFSFVIPNNNDISYVGIQETKSEINGGTTDINERTMFKFNGNGTFDIMFQSQSIYSASFSSGDNFSLKTNAVTGKISYYKNEVLLIETDYAPINTASSYMPKVVLGSGSSVSALKIIAPKKDVKTITGQVTDVTCNNICSGAIQASGKIFMGSPKYYEIYTLGGVTPFLTITAPLSNSVVFQNLCTGIYTIKYYADVTDLHVINETATPYVASTSQTFEVAYMPDWTNNVNVSINQIDRSLTKILPGINWTNDAGASSENTLPNSLKTEWIEFKVSGVGALGVGLSSSDPGLNPTTMDYWINIFGWDAQVLYTTYEKNTNRGHWGGVSYLKTNSTIYRIEKSSTYITFKVNNVVFDQIPVINSNINLIADVTISGFDSYLFKPRVSFGCIQNIQNYAVLKPGMDGHYYDLVGNNLKFTLDGEYTINSLKFKVLNNKQNIVISNYSNLLNNSFLKPGDNRYNLDCNTLPVGYYTLEVENEKNEKLYLRFKR